ncbi:MAG: PaaI family thioesterase [Acidimicrobiales bacterium]|nr:PaaI family thioesterase [Acidimicrobiales bacterium]
MVEQPSYGDFELKRFLGMTIEGDEPGRARGRVTVGERHLNPNGVVHGAVLFALVDTAMGKAVMSVLPEGRFCASVDVQLRFVRPASDGEIVADVEVLKQGRTVVHLDARVHDGEGRLVATAAGTFAVIGA